jgi:hypothetical protein
MVSIKYKVYSANKYVSRNIEDFVGETKLNSKVKIIALR